MSIHVSSTNTHDESTSHQRAMMMMERSYMASPSFEGSTSWFARLSRGTNILYNKSSSSPMKCSIVGIVSPDNLHLESHGNFEINGGHGTINRFQDAQYTVTLTKPGEAHSEFATDFTSSVQTAKNLAGNLYHSNASVLPFIYESDVEVSFRFSRAVFEPFVTYGQSVLDGVQPSSLENYVVRSDLRTYLDAIKPSHLSRNIRVRDQRHTPVPTGRRNAFLANRLVQIYFSLYFDPVIGLVAELNTVSAFEEDYSIWSVYL